MTDNPLNKNELDKLHKILNSYGRKMSGIHTNLYISEGEITAEAKAAIVELISTHSRDSDRRTIEARLDEVQKLITVRNKHKFTTKPGEYLDDRIAELRKELNQ